MYVESMYEYICNFKITVESAILNLKIQIELSLQLYLNVTTQPCSEVLFNGIVFHSDAAVQFRQISGP